MSTSWRAVGGQVEIISGADVVMLSPLEFRKLIGDAEQLQKDMAKQLEQSYFEPGMGWVRPKGGETVEMVGLADNGSMVVVKLSDGRLQTSRTETFTEQYNPTGRKVKK